jgi:hypothetical protein
MTKRITVSLPDDVAAYLDAEDNASAAVTDAVRARMRRGEATLAMMRATGMPVTRAGIDRIKGTVPPLSPAQRAESRRRADLLAAGSWGEEGERPGSAR